MQDTVEVELISNPLVYRTITRANFLNNTSKWKLRGTPDPEKKSQEVVKPVVVKKVETPVVTLPEKEQTSNPLIGGLRTQYENLSGKKPDGRWNLGRLTKEIKALEPVTA